MTSPATKQLIEIAAGLIEQRDEPLNNASARIHYWRDKAIDAARHLERLSALQQPDEIASEPVAWLYCSDDGSKELVLDCNGEYARRLIKLGWTEQPLFARTALGVDHG